MSSETQLRQKILLRQTPLFPNFANVENPSKSQLRQLRQPHTPLKGCVGAKVDDRDAADVAKVRTPEPPKHDNLDPTNIPTPWTDHQTDRIVNVLSWQTADVAAWILARRAHYQRTTIWPDQSCSFQAALDWELWRLQRLLPHGNRQTQAQAYFDILDGLEP